MAQTILLWVSGWALMFMGAMCWVGSYASWRDAGSRGHDVESTLPFVVGLLLMPLGALLWRFA